MAAFLPGLLLLHGVIFTQPYVLGGPALQDHKILPICDGPAPADWGLTPSSTTCPRWTADTAASACHAGFGASNWRCTHRICRCWYDTFGKSSITCFKAPWNFLIRPDVFFAAYRTHQNQFEREIPLASYCTQNCKCPQLDEDLLETLRLQQQQQYQKQSSDPGGESVSMLDEELDASSSEPDFLSSSWCNSRQCQSDICAVDCRGPGVCHEARAAGCSVNRCRANLMPESSASKFAAWGSCVQSFASRIGGRDVLPCACNSTYVSSACCASDDGNVWEEKSHALGQLEDL